MALLLGRLGLSLKIAAQALLSPVAYAACALIVREGRVLLVRHSYVQGWLLPGGGVGRGEPAEEAVLREMREEIGLLSCAAPRQFGLYTRKSGWATNVIVLFQIDDAQFKFVPNFEVRAVEFVDPLSPPADTPPSVRRRLREFAGMESRSPYW
ncbi:MAG: NUDIX domain-containing protein [Alphaproteobacteria bacterium]|nr:NUDIX domain-containing protein [Alphaproteobacteria bacterium]MBV9694505.1 NUDIX domain-containing protein [Alphaproteobacteria bacterium]